jgi:hypothetical protein
MAEVILDDVDRLARVEKMRRHRMTHRVYVPAVRREICEGGVAGEECLYPGLREPSLSAGELSPVVAIQGRSGEGPAQIPSGAAKGFHFAVKSAVLGFSSRLKSAYFIRMLSTCVPA